VKENSIITSSFIKTIKTKIMKTKIYKNKLVAILALFILLGGSTAYAVSANDLQSRIDRLNRQIEKNQSTLDTISHRRNTLENKLAAIDAEIAQLQAQIAKTNLETKKTSQEIKKAEEELARQKQIMFENARVLYKQGDITTLEAFAASDSFGDFINAQEYLERVKGAVNDAAQQVLALKEELEVKKEALEQLLQRQKAQENTLGFKRDEQQKLVDETRGEEAKYQAIVTRQRQQLEQAEKELLRRIVAGTIRGGNGAGALVKEGDLVKGGKHIAYVGSSGFSTGPHLHFALIAGGNYVDPVPYLNSGVEWPVPGYTDINPGFGPVHCSQYTGCADRNGDGRPDDYSVQHNGADIAAPAGTPVVATQDGLVEFSGCWAGSGFGNVVIIKHIDGKRTYYPHLSGPTCN
jgi:septal ring factor EnvC (AmiA/AmiB activator)